MAEEYRGIYKLSGIVHKWKQTPLKAVKVKPRWGFGGGTFQRGGTEKGS